MDFPVYIDTSLGHNFVMLVSDSDTVHDVKGKILLEYANCFPEMGEINAHAIKIDHRGTLYRLSESVLVGKVFEATIGARLLHVDASSTDPKYNEVRRSKDFLINSKECRDRNPTMLRIENNASHLLQCVPDIPCHSNRDGNSSGVIFDQNVHMVSDSPKKKSKRTKSIIGASGVGTSQSECGKGIDVSKVQKGMDYSYDLYKNVRQNASIKQGNNSSKRKDCGQQSDLQIDGQSDPRKKRHRREDVHTKFDIDKPQVACKEILSKKSEENIFDRTNDPIVKQNNIDLTSLNTPKERKKKKKSSGVSHKQKYNSETTSSHLTLQVANNDRSKHRKKKKKGKHSDNVEVKNILIAADNVEKSLADENGDPVIPMKNKSDTLTISSLETKNALAVSEKVNKEICRQLETPTSEFPLEKEQVISFAEESAMNENSKELVLTSPLDAKAQSNDLETPGFRTIASLPQKISSLPESLGAIGFQEDVDLVIPSEDDVSTASLANKDKSKHCKKKKKGKDSDNVEAKNILVAADNVEKLLADENRDSAIPMKSTKNTLSVSSLETKTALAAAENVIEKICRQIETPTSEFPFEKEKVILVGGESVMDENSTELVLTSPSDAKMRPVVGEEVNFAEFFLPDVAVAKKRPTVSPEDSGNRKSEIKNRHIFKSKHRELQEEFTTKEELIGGEDENMQRIAKSKRDVENSNMSMQVTVPHRNVHIPCESTHTSKETNLTGIQTRKRSTKSSDKKVHGGVLLSDLEPRELIDNKSHKVKGKASPVNKKTERTKSNSSRKSNSNLAVYSDDVGKETKDSLSVFDSKTKGRNDCYRIAFRKVSGGLLEILENSKTEKPLPFDSLSIFDHISDNVAKDKDTDNSKRQFDFSSSSSDSDSEISDVNETQTVHLHASQPFKESHGIHKSECISGDKSGNREILRHVTTGSQASGQEMKLGAILRNSRSYKKAKLVASQTPAEETEPESLL